MSYLAIVVYLVAAIWTWVMFGVIPGITVAVLGFVALNFIGRKLDAQFKPRSDSFLEFHEAWDSLLGPPMDADGLSAKRYQLSKWRSEAKGTNESAADWLERTTGRNQTDE